MGVRAGLTGVLLGVVVDAVGPALIFEVEGRGDDVSATDAVDLERVATGELWVLTDDCLGDAMLATFDRGVDETALTCPWGPEG